MRRGLWWCAGTKAGTGSILPRPPSALVMSGAAAGPRMPHSFTLAGVVILQALPGRQHAGVDGHLVECPCQKALQVPRAQPQGRVPVGRFDLPPRVVVERPG